MRRSMVDLFCGCGGFAWGARAAGFGPEIAFDVDAALTYSFQRNFPSADLVIQDLSEVQGSDILKRSGGDVLGVFGGPPCQAFSEIGRRKVDDPRRDLLAHFFRLVAEIQPAFFVMENVRGLSYSNARPVLDKALERIPGRYDILPPVILDAANYGAATKRQRLFVIGWDRQKCDPLSLVDLVGAQRQATTVLEAISDLSSAFEVGEERGFDIWELPPEETIVSPYRSRLVAADRRFTGHRKTIHTPAVQDRFGSLAQGCVDPVGRHPRLDWNGQCPTLRAGTGRDKGSYQAVRPIHPIEPRVISVREGARLQGFPDAFEFHPTVWHSYRMIGNSVSPIMSQAIMTLMAERVGVAKVAAE